MIPLTVITAFLTTIITIFFNSLSDTWKDLRGETKNIYATSIQNFVEEVKKCKGTPNPRLQSPFQSSGAIL